MKDWDDWGESAEKDIFDENSIMPIQPDLFKDSDVMPLEIQVKDSEEVIEPVNGVDSEEVVDSDLGDLNVAQAEAEYREATEKNSNQPEVITNTVVREVVRSVPNKESENSVKDDNKASEPNDADKLKAVVETVLDEKTADKLIKYEKRRKNRDRRRKIGFAIKLVVVLVIAVILYRNEATRERIAILAEDTVDFVHRIIIRDEDSSSNKLVNDALNTIGADLNKLNTKRETKYIYLDENGKEITKEEYEKDEKAVKVDIKDSTEKEE